MSGKPAQALWLLLPVALWGVLSLARTAPLPEWRGGVPTPRCQIAAPALWINGQAQPTPDRNGFFTLATHGLISQTVCQPGTLRFQARGTPADDLYPLMTVSRNTRTLLSTRVGDPKTYAVEIEQAGEVVVAFHDDRYLPDLEPPQDRNLFVEAWRFQPEP